ncbi:MAG: phage minor head protein [Eubacteriales bacterium]|nr:phage minor head protein [Eubacteriales bacterium]
MNKRQKAVLQVQIDNEKEVIRALKKIFEQAAKDCEAKIAELNSRTDMQNLQSIIYQKQYQQALKKQLEQALENLTEHTFSTISEYLEKCYEDGFLGVLYDIRGQGIPVIFPIDQTQVVKAIQTDTKLSEGMYSRLGEDTAYLKKSIQAELSRGISNGSSWLEIASHIANGMNSPFKKAINNAIRIARTEGHRIQCEAAYHAQKEAKDRGAEIVKRWDSTLDDRTRDSHKILDGQIREIEDYFEVNGHRALHPGAFGVASEDIHCRCVALQNARWALEGGICKMNNFSKQLMSFEDEKSYSDFKKDFFSKENVQYMKYVNILMERYQTKYFDEKLLGKLTDREYNHYIKLLNATPIYKRSDYK